jgi:Na+-transporting NADH:ubiquinone oxidoreductase subunit F
MGMSTNVSIVVNDKIRINAATQISLFSVLNQNHIFLPSICGGRGICGKCRCRVLEGAGNPSPAEEKKLSIEELRDFYRLSCQVIVERDLRIEIPESILQENAYEAKVLEIKSLTGDIKRVSFTLLKPAEMRFRPGQYVQLQSKPYENVRESVMRSYSIASPRQSRAQIDLMVRLVPEGICSTWVHQHLRVGEDVTLVGPRGDFFLRDGSMPVIMVAGGSGMAPIFSMLHEIADSGVPREVTYFFGACREKDLFYMDEMGALAARMPSFRFVPVLSDPERIDACKLEIGLVTEPFENHMKKRGSGPLQVYLCGSPGMVQKCREIAVRYGVPLEQIFYDPFN